MTRKILLAFGLVVLLATPAWAQSAVVTITCTEVTATFSDFPEGEHRVTLEVYGADTGNGTFYPTWTGAEHTFTTPISKHTSGWVHGHVTDTGGVQLESLDNGSEYIAEGECAPAPTPSPSPTPTETPAPSPTPVESPPPSQAPPPSPSPEQEVVQPPQTQGGGGGGGAGGDKPGLRPKPPAPVPVEELAFTGTEDVPVLLAVALGLVAAGVLMLRKARRIER